MTNLERRNFIQSAGVLAGAAAATSLIEQPALAQNAQQTGAKPMTYQAKPLFTATDRTFAGAGKIALWTKADSVTRFDRIEIKPLP